MDSWGDLYKLQASADLALEGLELAEIWGDNDNYERAISDAQDDVILMSYEFCDCGSVNCQ